MKVLVVGANGFLGKNLVQKCLSLGWSVDCVYHEKKESIPQECVSYSHDALSTIKTAYDTVFLVAAAIPYGKYDEPSDAVLKSNIKLPLLVAEKFTKSKLVFCSSVAVYGNHASTIREDSPHNSPTFYGLTKLAGETIVRFHPRGDIIRFSSLYGRGMNSKTFLPMIVQQAKKSKKITLFGDGSRAQDYIHIQDAIGYLLASATSTGSGIYLGVSGLSRTNQEAAAIVKRVVPGCEIEYLSKEESPSFRYDNQFTKKKLHFSPSISLEEGIKDLFFHE